MNRMEFESEVRAQGYLEIIDRSMPANHTNPEHAHDFDARLFVLEGEMSIARDGRERTYRAGDSFEVSAGSRHAERSGPEGVRYLAGRRYPKTAG